MKHTTQDSQPELPYPKLCECGCGQPAPIAKRTDGRFGHVKGQPIRFIRSHGSVKSRVIPDMPTLPPGTRAIPLTQGKIAIIDEADYAELSRYRWCAIRQGRNWYATRKGNIRMHRVIVGAAPGEAIDHIDGNGLNNTRANLRLATKQENNWNANVRSDTSSGYKGVSWKKRNRKWQAGIRANNIRTYLGIFDDPEEAAHAYDTAARKLHGEFARLNFD